MANSNSVMIHKLQKALNLQGQKILYNTSQFYSDKQNRPVTCYHIKRAVYNEQTGKNKNEEIFKSTSQIQIVLFLRDYLFIVQGKELPTDNETWNEIRKTTILGGIENGKNI